MTHDNCRLTAKNRDQLRNPTLGNRVWGLPFLITELLTDVRVGVRARLDGDRRALAGGWLGARATEAGGDERRRRR